MQDEWLAGQSARQLDGGIQLTTYIHMLLMWINKTNHNNNNKTGRLGELTDA